MGSEARARLGLAGLLAATLFSFGQVYASDDYFGASLLGILLAVGIAIGCRRVGAGPFLTIWISVTALAWYVVIVFEARRTFYLLPTPAAASGINGALARAIEASRVDFAPIPVRPGYIILTVVGMWLLATIAEVATFRWRRPLLASVGPIALFTMCMVVGTGSGTGMLVVLFLAALLTFWGLEASHRLRSWGRWVGAWTQADGSEAESVTGRVARRMGYASVVALLVAPAVVPALGNELTSWRSSAGEGGFGLGGGGAAVSPIVDLKPQLVNRSADELFTVEARQASYWRVLSLSDFDGRLWQQGEAETRSPASGVVAPRDDLPGLDRTLVQRFDLTGLEGGFYPAAERPEAVELPDGEVRVNEDTLGLQAADGDVSDEEYRVTSRVAGLSYNRLAGAPIGDLGDEWVARYTALPEGVSERVRALARQWTEGIADPFEQLVTIQHRFQSGSYGYSLDVPEPESPDFLDDFLFTSRVGYCQQFAGAFAVLARSLGLPTRVSVGYLPGGQEPERSGVYIVRGRETHAWPEVYFADYGWVRFEPTPRDISRVPSYTLPPIDVGPGLGTPSQVENAAPNPRTGREPGAQAGACNALAGRLQEQCNRPGGATRQLGPPLDRGPREDYAWEETFSVVARTALAAAALFLLSVPLLKELRARRRYRRAADDSGRTVAAFGQFLDDAADLSGPRLAAESASSYVARLTRAGALDGAPARRLADLYERAEYSLAGVDAHDGLHARRLARDLRRSLWKRAPWWRRAARVLSPATLTSSGGRGSLRPLTRLGPRRAGVARSG